MRVHRPVLLTFVVLAAIFGAAGGLSAASQVIWKQGDSIARKAGQGRVDERHRAHRRHFRIGNRIALPRRHGQQGASQEQPAAAAVGVAASPAPLGLAPVTPPPAAPAVVDPPAPQPQPEPQPEPEPQEPAPSEPAPEPPAEEPAPPAEEPPAEEPPPAAEEPPAKGPLPGEPAPEEGKGTGGVTPPPPSPGSLTIGIDGGYAGWGSTEVKMRTALGAAVTRHEWDPNEPVNEQDDVVELAAGTIHTRIHALLAGNELGDPAHYRDWVVAFVRYYGPGGSFWAAHPNYDASRYAIDTIELGNEPYFGAMSPEEYAETVLPAVEEIKRLDLPVRVVLPVYVYGEDDDWLEILADEIPNLSSLFDAFAFHPYWYGHHPATSGDESPFERIGFLRQRMDELGFVSKPIYLTEYGESTANCGDECVSEAEQATHLGAMIDAITTHPEWKVTMLSVFQLLDRGTNSGDRELQFGLLRQDGTEKPSYAIVRAAMQAFR